MNKLERPIYSNDRTAPRMKKGKYSEQVVTNELIKEFKAKYPDYKKKTNKELIAVWATIAKVIRQEIIKNPLGVKLGSYTGELKLQYIPYKFKAQNKGTSEEIGERINHLNIVTKGKVAKLKWERRWAVKFNRMLQFFAFGATRQLEIAAKEHILENPESVRISRTTLGGEKYK